MKKLTVAFYSWIGIITAGLLTLIILMCVAGCSPAPTDSGIPGPEGPPGLTGPVGPKGDPGEPGTTLSCDCGEKAETEARKLLDPALPASERASNYVALAEKYGEVTEFGGAVTINWKAVRAEAMLECPHILEVTIVGLTNVTLEFVAALTIDNWEEYITRTDEIYDAQNTSIYYKGKPGYFFVNATVRLVVRDAPNYTRQWVSLTSIGDSIIILNTAASVNRETLEVRGLVFKL